MVGAIYNSSGTKTGDVKTSAVNYGLQDETMKGWVKGQEKKRNSRIFRLSILGATKKLGI